MADVYLTTNLTYPPGDVILFTELPVKAGAEHGGNVKLRAHGPLQRKALTGRGHLHVVFVLAGEPGPVPTLDGEGTVVTTGTLRVALRPARSQVRTFTPLIHTSGTARTSGQLTPVMTATRTRIIDPDEWLILDLPELA